MSFIQVVNQRSFLYASRSNQLEYICYWLYIYLNHLCFEDVKQVLSMPMSVISSITFVGEKNKIIISKDKPIIAFRF